MVRATKTLIKISGFIGTMFIVLLGPALTAASIVMGWEVSTAIHVLTLQAHDMFGDAVAEISWATAAAADFVITMLGMYLAYLFIQSINSDDEESFFHLSLWQEQKRQYLANSPITHEDGQRSYSAWSYFRNVKVVPPTTDVDGKVTPRREIKSGINGLGLLVIGFILLFAASIVNYIVFAGSLYYPVFMTFMLIPMGTTIFTQYTYNELGVTNKVAYTTIIVSASIAVLYAILAYYIYKYAFAYPYAKLLSDPAWVAKHFADHFPAGKAIGKDGLPVKAFADNLVDLWNAKLIVFASRQLMMFVLDVVAGIVLLFGGEGAGIGKIMQMAGAVNDALYTTSYQEDLPGKRERTETPKAQREVITKVPPPRREVNPTTQDPANLNTNPDDIYDPNM